MNRIKSITLSMMLSLLVSTAIAGAMPDEECLPQKNDMTFGTQPFKLSGVTQTNLVYKAKSKQERCGDIEIVLLQFSQGEMANNLNSIVAKITPKELLKLDSPLPIEALDSLIKAKRKDNIIDYYYKQETDWLTTNIFSLSETLYVFTGGAHGSTTIQKMSFDLKTHKPVTLEGLLSKAAVKPIMALAKSQFIQAHELETKKSLNEQGFWFSPADNASHLPWVDEEGFYLPTNFNLTEKGIVFIFQQYEVGPYSMGLLDFTLPWDQVIPYLVAGALVR